MSYTHAFQNAGIISERQLKAPSHAHTHTTPEKATQAELADIERLKKKSVRMPTTSEHGDKIHQEKERNYYKSIKKIYKQLRC